MVNKAIALICQPDIRGHEAPHHQTKPALSFALQLLLLRQTAFKKSIIPFNLPIIEGSWHRTSHSQQAPIMSIRCRMAIRGRTRQAVRQYITAVGTLCLPFTALSATQPACWTACLVGCGKTVRFSALRVSGVSSW